MLAFAFLATFGFNGLVTLFLHDRLGVDIFAWGAWIYELPGLIRRLHLLPDPAHGDRLPARGRGPAAAMAGGLREPGRQRLDVLAPRRLPDPAGPPSSAPTLLLFANAFSAYATAKALISQASPLVPLQIGTFLTSEIVLGQANVGKALAFGMIVIVARDHGALRAAAEADLAMAALSGAGRRSFGPRRCAASVLLVIGVYMLLPLIAMLEFSTRGVGGARSLAAWIAIGANPDLRRRDAGLARARRCSPSLLMLVLLVPTMIWVQLRLPQLRRVVEFICLLPLTIPAIVLVVGLAPIYRWVCVPPRRIPVNLTFVYTILVLPFAYRAIAAGLGRARPRDARRGRPQPRLLAGSA